jgi:hypothetical protein
VVAGQRRQAATRIKKGGGDVLDEGRRREGRQWRLEGTRMMDMRRRWADAGEEHRRWVLGMVMSG